MTFTIIATFLLSSLVLSAQVSVKTYGAKGDGSTDDTASFNAALVANTFVQIPCGKYNVTGIKISSGRTLAGYTSNVTAASGATPCVSLESSRGDILISAGNNLQGISI